MKQGYKLISLFLTILLLFILTLITYYNDLKSYTILFLSLTVISFIYLIYFIFNKKDPKNIYKKKIDRILKVYNSSIVKMTNTDNNELLNENVVSAKNIEDLFELSDEFNQPIVYLEEENASIFILQYGKDILYYVMKLDEGKETNFEKQIKEYKNEKEKLKDEEKEILSNIDKTTIIQLKNNKFYKIKPVKK